METGKKKRKHFKEIEIKTSGFSVISIGIHKKRRIDFYSVKKVSQVSTVCIHINKYEYCSKQLFRGSDSIKMSGNDLLCWTDQPTGSDENGFIIANC